MVLSTELKNQIIGLVIAFVVVILLHFILKRLFLKRVSTKSMRHNVIVFVDLVTYLYIFLVMIFAVVFFSKGNISFGILAGLVTAGLGWALQRPITGIAAWIMVIFSKPFKIGDRIIIPPDQGDVINISLTHVHLREFGGTTGGEETSGRTILIPNSLLFEKDIINYTLKEDFILDETAFTMTHTSDIDVAKKIGIDSVRKITEKFLEKVPSQPYTRLTFQSSGVDIRVRYYIPPEKRYEYQTMITEEIFKRIMKEQKVNFAYPHSRIYHSEHKTKNN